MGVADQGLELNVMLCSRWAESQSLFLCFYEDGHAMWALTDWIAPSLRSTRLSLSSTSRLCVFVSPSFSLSIFPSGSLCLSPSLQVIYSEHGCSVIWNKQLVGFAQSLCIICFSSFSLFRKYRKRTLDWLPCCRGDRSLKSLPARTLCQAILL